VRAHLILCTVCGMRCHVYSANTPCVGGGGWWWLWCAFQVLCHHITARCVLITMFTYGACASRSSHACSVLSSLHGTRRLVGGGWLCAAGESPHESVCGVWHTVLYVQRPARRVWGVGGVSEALLVCLMSFHPFSNPSTHLLEVSHDDDDDVGVCDCVRITMRISPCDDCGAMLLRLHHHASHTVCVERARLTMCLCSSLVCMCGAVAVAAAGSRCR
jgi:hypothetical protein